MWLQSLKIALRDHAGRRSQRRIARLALKGGGLLVPAARGYAMRDVQEFSADGPGGCHRLFVAIPRHPAPQGGFPLIYLLDANGLFGVILDSMRLQMQWPEVSEVKPAIIVGVGYPGDGPFDMRRRSWDMAPPPQGDGTGAALGFPWHRPGGAAAFRDYLTGPLLDELAARYSLARDRRGVVGLSLGGTFALHTLAVRPDAFRFYGTVSPALWYDDNRVLAELRATGSLAGRHAFIAVGAQEVPGDAAISAMMTDNATAAATAIRKASGQAELVIGAGENHQSMIVAAMPALLRAASRAMG